MGTSATTSAVYIHVIDDVINKIREEFVNNSGPGESVLHELQRIWEMKMMQAGAILGPIDRSGGPKTGPGGGPVHDLNVPYEGTEEYETPTAEMLFPPTPMQTPLPTPLPGSIQTPLPGNVQTPLPGSVDSFMYNIPTGSSSDYPTPISDIGGATEAKAGRPSAFMPPPSAWMNQKPPLSVDVNVAYVEGRDEFDRGASHHSSTQNFFTVSSGKRKRDEFAPQYNNGGSIPQQDGAGDAVPEVLQASQGNNMLTRDRSTTVNVELVVHAARSSSFKIPQQDGPIPDPYDDMLSTPNIDNYPGVVNEDYNIASTPAPTDLQANTPAVVLPQNDNVDEDEDEEPLNEDDDEEDDLDDLHEDEELNTQHLLLAQFDKVTRAKSKWRCTLKDGIMHVNNKDVLFNKATGEFDF